ncbi:hypothetical protein PRZ48_002090 [Zasmidium cellare]|uniref:Uncharacterized protein n=1 Tax=Zasmidium cellare TaxID=395010 RepID=A0ABR0F3A4_ZASCE|nr:hypothetical protein PRZ48_002090 [Zasmidium cellare]
MAVPEAESSLDALSLSGTTYTPSTSTYTSTDPTKFAFPAYTSFPPFYTLQPNLTTRARQLELWSSLITSYCAHHRLFKLSLSSPPSDLFNNTSIKRSLKLNDIRTALEHMSQPSTGPLIEWIAPVSRGEQSNTCWVYWRSLGEWADTIYNWVDETGQKGAVLTVYELREGDAVKGKEWQDIDEALLRKILGVLVKRGKCQIFGQEENAGVNTKREADLDSASEPEIKAPASLYDAVAGRVNRDGFILSSDEKPAAPDEVLFSRANAPIRYEETDTYFAHRNLPAGVRLPGSDLLKTIHAYVSDFYGSGVVKDCELDWGSMDETALMAMGILLEEAAASKLGKTGDLAFVEGEKMVRYTDPAPESDAS